MNSAEDLGRVKKLLDIEATIYNKFVYEFSRDISNVLKVNIHYFSTGGQEVCIHADIGDLVANCCGRDLIDRSHINIKIHFHKNLGESKLKCRVMRVDNRFTAIKHLSVYHDPTLERYIDFDLLNRIFCRVTEYCTDEAIQSLEHILKEKFNPCSDKLYRLVRNNLADGGLISKFIFCVSDERGVEFGLLHSSVSKSFQDNFLKGGRGEFKDNLVARLARLLMTDVPKKSSPLEYLVSSHSKWESFEVMKSFELIDYDFALMVARIYGHKVVYRPISRNRLGFCLVANFPESMANTYEEKLKDCWVQIEELFEKDVENIREGIRDISQICEMVIKRPLSLQLDDIKRKNLTGVLPLANLLSGLSLLFDGSRR